MRFTSILVLSCLAAVVLSQAPGLGLVDAPAPAPAELAETPAIAPDTRNFPAEDAAL